MKHAHADIAAASTLGWIDDCSAGGIDGHVLLPFPGAPAPLIDIRIDGALAARLPADRPDPAGNASARRFQFRFPPSLTAGKRRLEIAAEVAGSGIPLSGGPRIVSLQTRPPRIACLLPAGRRVGHDDVASSLKGPREHIAQYANTGDWTVYDSSMKLLSFSELKAFNAFAWTESDVAKLNEECDYVFLRGSNYLHGKTDWREMAALLARIRIPVVPFSIGAQAPSRQSLDLPPSSIEVWKAFADACNVIGARGTYTAEILDGIGIRNVEIIGCPSLFRRNDPYLRIKAPPLSEIRRVAFSLRREIATTYTANVAYYLKAQKRLLLDIAGRFDITVSVHGERAEKAFFYRDPETLPGFREELVRKGWFAGPDDPLIPLYESRLFYNTAVADYDTMLAGQDLAVGFRVHGVLPALAQGVPGLMVAYDTRGEELAQAFDLPVLKLDAVATTPFADLYAGAGFEAFNRNFRGHYRRMRRFLERNGMAHNMLPG